MTNTTDKAMREALTACKAACERIIDQYERVSFGIDFGALLGSVETALASSAAAPDRADRATLDTVCDLIAIQMQVKFDVDTQRGISMPVSYYVGNGLGYLRERLMHGPDHVRDAGDVISHFATPDWFATQAQSAPAAALTCEEQQVMHKALRTSVTIAAAPKAPGTQDVEPVAWQSRSGAMPSEDFVEWEHCTRDYYEQESRGDHPNDVRALYTRPTAPAEPAERAVDESAIQRMTAAGREAWKGVPDASAWVDEMRGEPADPVTEARLPTPVRKRIDAAAHAMSLAMAHYELKHHTDDFARALAGLRALQANDTTKGTK